MKERNKISPWSLQYLINNPDKDITITQDKWYRDPSNGRILIDVDQKFKISPENKREWFYDSFGRLVDTKPFFLNNGQMVKTEKSILYYLPSPLNNLSAGPVQEISLSNTISEIIFLTIPNRKNIITI